MDKERTAKECGVKKEIKIPSLDLFSFYSSATCRAFILLVSPKALISQKSKTIWNKKKKMRALIFA